MTKPRLTDIQKSEILDKWNQSSLPLQDFCQQESISPSALRRWRYQQRELLTIPTPPENDEDDWIEIANSKPDNLEAKPEPSPTSNWRVELVLPGDIILRLGY